jgi:membrane protein
VSTEAAPAPRAPESPTDLPKRSWRQTVKRTVQEFRDDNITDWAAALTYYSVLGLFPALIVLVSILGLLGQDPRTTDALFQILRDSGASASTIDVVREPLQGVIRSKGGAGALLGVGLLAALWSASGYLGAFMRASNDIYEVKEGRPFWKLRPLQVVVTLAGAITIALVLVAIVLTGPLAEGVGNAIGLGATAVTVWNIAKWPVLVAIVMGLVAALYWIAPNVRQPRVRWISPGGVIAVALWALVTAGFFFYVKNFGSYNKTYGTLAGVVVLLVWVWLTNIALLFGAEFDAELERSRELEAGVPADEFIQLPPREPADDEHPDRIPDPATEQRIEAANGRAPEPDG